MIIKSTKQLATYEQATKISTQILAQVRDAVAEEVTPAQLDALADDLCKKHKVVPNFKGQGSSRNLYKWATCISVNDEVVHGVPNDKPLKKGDLVKLDFGILYKGLNTDQCVTVVVGNFIDDEDERLVKTTRQAIQKAVHLAIAGKKTGDLGYAMQSIAEKAGFSVVREFVGHGIGKTLHEEPQIAAYGKKNSGQVLREGMVICIEAQVVAGSDEIYIDGSGWTVKTADGKKSAMFEYMVIVGKERPVVLTETMDWRLVIG